MEPKGGEFGPLRNQGGLPGGSDAEPGMQRMRSQVAKKRGKSIAGEREEPVEQPCVGRAREGSKVAGGQKLREEGWGVGGGRGCRKAF